MTLHHESNTMPVMTPHPEHRARQARDLLFHLCARLHQFDKLDELLDFIARSIHEWMAVGGALVILRDEATREFYFPVAAFDDEAVARQFKTIRFPSAQGVAGHVCRTGHPLIVADYAASPYALPEIDARSGYITQSMLGVPLRMRSRMVGVLCAVNKSNGRFDEQDAALLGAIAGMAVLPIENARIHAALEKSLQRVQDFNLAKDRVIHHLSHELKTPLAVLGAALRVLKNKLPGPPSPQWNAVHQRAKRNLERLTAMQYEIEDILRERDYSSHAVMSHLLEACTDLLETLALDQLGADNLPGALRTRIDSLFGPADEGCAAVQLDDFAVRVLDRQKPRFAHRRIVLNEAVEPVGAVRIPSPVLVKVMEGVVRNAVENTPDGGRIDIRVNHGAKGPRFIVRDFGVGMEEQRRRLIAGNYFTDYEPLDYASGQPFDFGAGGRGFDLLRIVIFSERHGFDFRIDSHRCDHLVDGSAVCPGDVGRCDFCSTPEDCVRSGGTCVTVDFPPEKAVCEF